MRRYYEQLAGDLSDAGMDGVFTDEPHSYSALVHTLKLISKNLRYTEALITAPQAQPRTTLSKTVAEVIKNNVRFEEHRAFPCCALSEPRLINNISEANTDDEPALQPFVVVDDGRAVGIIKTQGDSTCYGLETNPQLGLVKGVFSALESHHKFVPYEFPPSRRPWSVEVDDVDRLMPIRLSAFLLPVSVRQSLPDVRQSLPGYSQDTAAALAASHDYIASRAEELLANAQPVPAPATAYASID